MLRRAAKVSHITEEFYDLEVFVVLRSEKYKTENWLKKKSIYLESKKSN